MKVAFLVGILVSVLVEFYTYVLVRTSSVRVDFCRAGVDQHVWVSAHPMLGYLLDPAFTAASCGPFDCCCSRAAPNPALLLCPTISLFFILTILYLHPTHTYTFVSQTATLTLQWWGITTVQFSKIGLTQSTRMEQQQIQR